MNRPMWMFGLLIVFMAGGVLLLFSNSYYPALPLDGIKKREVVNKMEVSMCVCDGELIWFQTDGNKSWYGYKGSLPDGKQALTALMRGRGLSHIEQLGAGHFFEDSMGNRVIVESQQWTGRYILFEVPD